MTHTPRLSVTLLNYNYGRFLAECLDSILAQTYTDFEVIVIDDSSTDDSILQVKPFLDDPRVRLIAHASNQGTINSLIEGVESSASPYVTVISADDLVLSRTAFEQQMKLLEANPNTSFCYGAWIYMDATGQPISKNVPFSEDHVWPGELEFKELCTRLYVLHSGTIIRRHAYNAVGGYDRSLRYAVDTMMWATLCGVGEVAYVAQPIYGYRTHGSQLSRGATATRITIYELLRVVDRGFANLPDGPVKSDQRLIRRARQAAATSMATMHVFEDHFVAGWKALLYAARLRPRDALFQRQVAILAARTVLRARGFAWLRSRLALMKPDSRALRSAPVAGPK